MRLKGEKWILTDGRVVIITWDFPNGLIRILNDDGKLEVISEVLLKERVV